jgi:hypothetical protein
MEEDGDPALAAAVEACLAAVDACCATAPARVAAAFATAVAAALRSTAGAGAASPTLGGVATDATVEATAVVADSAAAAIVDIAASGAATAISSARAVCGLKEAWRPAAASIAGRSSDRTRPRQLTASVPCVCLAALAVALLLRCCRGSLLVHVSCQASASTAVSASRADRATRCCTRTCRHCVRRQEHLTKEMCPVDTVSELEGHRKHVKGQMPNVLT